LKRLREAQILQDQAQDPPRRGPRTDTHGARFTAEEEHGLKVFNLSNIKLIFLPPNLTANSQPCDQGIIASSQMHCRGLLVRWMLEQANRPGNENKQLKDLAPTVYQAIQWSLLAWKEKVAANTVKNCWRKSGLLPDSVLDLTAAAPAAPFQSQISAEADDLEAAPLEVAADTSDSTAEPALRELAEAMQSLRWLSSVACCLKSRTL
jgi:hypothetical protein